jgi:hypothetical protein
MSTEPDYFVKQGDFQNLAAGRPTLFYRGLDQALDDWVSGWRDLFLGSFPGLVAAIDAAVDFDPDAEYVDEDDEDDEDEDDE